jgi:glyoxylase-like metal-dependent hydrolase (beta-lactamase superfamily II)
MSTPQLLESGIWFTDVALAEYSVRGVLLVDAERALVWDTLSHPRDMAGSAPVIGNRDLAIAYSHADWDHVWGTAGLPHQKAVILGHRSCLARFATDVPETLRERQAAEPLVWDDVQLVAPNRVFAGETSLDLGALTLTFHHLPGHTPDSIVAHVPERGVLLAGDAAETPFPVVPEGCALPEWIAGLERWARDPDVRTVVPAHGAIAGREILEQNIRYLEGLRDGRPVDASGPLTPFYRKTHLSNLRACGLAR